MKAESRKKTAGKRREFQNRLFIALVLLCAFAYGVYLLWKNPPELTLIFDLTELAIAPELPEETEETDSTSPQFDLSELAALQEAEPELTEGELFACGLLAKESREWREWSVTQLGSRAEEVAANAPVHYATVSTDYFDDALFIGDSRIRDMYFHGGLSNATFFVKDGLSIFTIQYDSVTVDGYGTLKYQQIMQKREWGKVYIMLGANEAYGRIATIQEDYEKVLANTREILPNAIIYLCAPQHVSAYKSAHSDCTNDKLNQIADVLEALSETDDNCYFLDVNPLFDDENGCLPSNITSDGVHMYISCYGQWIEWLCQHAILPEEPEPESPEAETIDAGETAEEPDTAAVGTETAEE